MMKSKKDAQQAASAESGEQRIIDALRKGYHDCDAALLASLYADDAEIMIFNRNNPPSKSMVVRGRDAILRMFEDVCGREMTHRIDDVTVGTGAVAFSAHCSYPDGCQVVGLNRASVENGRIVREINVNCWDE
jgi:ketosteroid isomerase-like protein